MKEFGNKSPYSTLKMKLPEGTNPTLSQSNVQYEKGYQLLVYLEKITGEEAFQKML